MLPPSTVYPVLLPAASNALWGVTLPEWLKLVRNYHSDIWFDLFAPPLLALTDLGGFGQGEVIELSGPNSACKTPPLLQYCERAILAARRHT
jgi:hypothetical protein